MTILDVVFVQQRSQLTLFGIAVRIKLNVLDFLTKGPWRDSHHFFAVAVLGQWLRVLPRYGARHAAAINLDVGQVGKEDFRLRVILATGDLDLTLRFRVLRVAGPNQVDQLAPLDFDLVAAFPDAHHQQHQDAQAQHVEDDIAALLLRFLFVWLRSVFALVIHPISFRKFLDSIL